MKEKPMEKLNNLLRYEIKYKVGHKVYTNESPYLEIKVDNELKITIIPSQKIELVSAKMFLAYDHSRLLFCNGFQTWSFTKEYHISEKNPHLSLLAKLVDPLAKPSAMGDYKWCKQDKLVSHTYTYLRKDNEILFYGTLNERSGFTSFHFKKYLEVHKDVEKKTIEKEFVIFSLVCYKGTSLSSLVSKYATALKLEKKEYKTILGYTSWYRHYQNIDEKKLDADLNGVISHLAIYPASLFQIDDGFAEHVGDWLRIDKKKFPNGLKPLVEKITEHKLTPGIWLAPFVIEKDSALFKEHPEFILNKGTRNWSGIYHLNIEKQEVKDYLHEVFTYYKNLGFKFFKLDFLYAASVLPLNGKSRAEVMYDAIDFLVNELQGMQILACGVPLSSVFGKVDYCRIGSDVTLNYVGSFPTNKISRERMSTYSAIQNTFSRNHLDKKMFGNDSDVFILRKTDLSEAEQNELFEAAIHHSSLILHSDNMDEYGEKELTKLKEILEVI